MANVSLSPYPYTAEQEALDRKRKLALLLQQESLQPIQEPSVPGANASPFQGVAKLVQALIGNYQNHKLDEQQKGLDTKIQTERTGRAQDMANALIGKPPDSSVTVPMAPTQAMPVPSTLTPEDLQATQLPGGTPYSPPTPPPQTPEGARTITAPNIQGQEKAAGLRNLLAQSLASPDPAQQQFGQMVAAKSLTEGDEQHKEAFQLMLKQLELDAASKKPVSVGSGGLLIPGQGIVGAQPHNIDPLSAPGLAAQIQLRNTPQGPMSPERLAQEVTLKGSPAAPAQSQPPMSPERFAQELQLSRDKAAAQHTLPSLDFIQETTGNGATYIDASKVEPRTLNDLQEAAGKAKIPVVDKDTAQGLRDAATVKASQQRMMDLLDGRLADNPMSRLFVAPENKAKQIGQIDPNLAVTGSFIGPAIQSLRAMAGSKNFRITQAEITAAIDNFTPKITDTVPVARKKLETIDGFLKDKEGVVLGNRGGSSTPSGGARVRTYNPATGKLE